MIFFLESIKRIYSKIERIIGEEYFKGRGRRKNTKMLRLS